MSLLDAFRHGVAEWIGSLPAGTTATAIAAALQPIAGSLPQVSSYGSYAEITFTPEQEDRITEWMLSQLRREPGPVRVEATGIAAKVITRQYWPYILGLLAAGGAVGYMVARAK